MGGNCLHQPTTRIPNSYPLLVLVTKIRIPHPRYKTNLLKIYKKPTIPSFALLRYQAGPKGRNLEVGARRAPRLLVVYIYGIGCNSVGCNCLYMNGTLYRNMALVAIWLAVREPWWWFSLALQVPAQCQSIKSQNAKYLALYRYTFTYIHKTLSKRSPAYLVLNLFDHPDDGPQCVWVEALSVLRHDLPTLPVIRLCHFVAFFFHFCAVFASHYIFVAFHILHVHPHLAPSALLMLKETSAEDVATAGAGSGLPCLIVAKVVVVMVFVVLLVLMVLVGMVVFTMSLQPGVCSRAVSWAAPLFGRSKTAMCDISDQDHSYVVMISSLQPQMMGPTLQRAGGPCWSCALVEHMGWVLEGGGEGSPACDNSDHDAAGDQQGIKNPTDTTKINIKLFITPPSESSCYINGRCWVWFLVSSSNRRENSRRDEVSGKESNSLRILESFQRLVEVQSFSYDKTDLGHRGHGPGRWARWSHRGILGYCADFRGSCLRCVRAVSWRHSLDRAVPWGEPHIWAPLGATGQTRAGLLCRWESPLLVSQRRFEAVLALQCCCHALAPAIEDTTRWVSNFWTFEQVTFHPVERF